MDSCNTSCNMEISAHLVEDPNPSTNSGGVEGTTTNSSTGATATTTITTGAPTAATASTTTNSSGSKNNDDFDINKSFILDYVVDEGVLLPFEFYSDLSPGIYIGLKFVCIRDVYLFRGKHKLKSGYYDYALLLYSKDENRFIQLLPCYYTVKRLQKNYESSFLRNDENVMILEKRLKKEGVRRPQQPLWGEDKLCNHFDPFTQFHLYDVFSTEDDRVGKVKKLVKKSAKEYFKFARDLLLL